MIKDIALKIESFIFDNLMLVIFVTTILLIIVGGVIINDAKQNNKYNQKTYDLNIPNKNCKLYVINIIDQMEELRIVECDGVISAPIQVEHHSTSHGTSYTNDITPIVIKDK